MNFRSNIFKEAHRLFKLWKNDVMYKNEVVTFSEALKRAWKNYKFFKSLKEQRPNVKNEVAKKDLTTEQIQKVARNINAFNTLYDYIDGYNNKWQFWSDLRTKLEKILETLTDNAKEQVRVLCEPQQAEYFGL